MALACPYVQNHRLRWRLPWGVRLRAAQLLLAAVLAARAGGKGGEATSDDPELEQLLCERLWPALGISAAVHDALQPFLLFRAYCESGAHRTLGPALMALVSSCPKLSDASVWQDARHSRVQDGKGSAHMQKGLQSSH